MTRLLVAALLVALVACRTVTTSTREPARAAAPKDSLAWMVEQWCLVTAGEDAGSLTNRAVDGCLFRCEAGRLDVTVLDGGTCLEPHPPEVVGAVLEMICRRSPAQVHEWDEGSCHLKCLGNSTWYSDRADAGEHCPMTSSGPGPGRPGDFPPFGPPWDDGARAPRPHGP